MMKRFLMMILIGILITTSVYAEADFDYKEESIFGVLNDDGSIEQVDVINKIMGRTEDFGPYDQIINLTSQDSLEISDGKVVLPETDDLFYYQGTILNPMLPWIFNLEYFLDGQPVDAETLGGASGDLEIHLTIGEGDANLSPYFENYALQIGISLDEGLCRDIEAEGATMVTVGGKQEISYVMMPGQETTYTVKAKVHDFKMSPITITGIQMVFNMNLDALAFGDQLADLTTAVEGLNDGAMALKNGLTIFSEGFQEYVTGMEAFKTGMREYYFNGLTMLHGLDRLSQQMTLMVEANDELIMGMEAMAMAALGQVDQELAAMGLTLPPLSRHNYQAILSSDPALLPVLINLEQTLALTDGVVSYLNGVAAMESAIADFDVGFRQYMSGGSVLSLTAVQLYEGAETMNTGLKELVLGMNAYQAGTQRFQDETLEMDAQLSGQVDAMLLEFLGTGIQPTSFASVDNGEILSVQFFFRTRGIEKAEPPKASEPESVEETLWDRVIKLFKNLFQ